jgi:hypothetical protein
MWLLDRGSLESMCASPAQQADMPGTPDELTENTYSKGMRVRFNLNSMQNDEILEGPTYAPIIPAIINHGLKFVNEVKMNISHFVDKTGNCFHRWVQLD